MTSWPSSLGGEGGDGDGVGGGVVGGPANLEAALGRGLADLAFGPGVEGDELRAGPNAGGELDTAGSLDARSRG